MLFFSYYIMSDSLWPYGVKYARLPWPSLSPGVCANSRPLSQWCHPTISSSVIPLSCCLQSFPELGSFPVSQLFTSGGQSIGASASASVLPINIQGWFPLDWLVWSLCSPTDSQDSSPAPQFQSINYFVLSLLHGPIFTSIHGTGKTTALPVQTFLSLLKHCLGLS